MKLDQLLEEKRGEILRIAAEHGAREVRVFGSVACGEDDGESDIDFLVELETARGLKARIRERVLREAVSVFTRCGLGLARKEA